MNSLSDRAFAMKYVLIKDERLGYHFCVEKISARTVMQFSAL